jgi:ribosomal protein S18 acetylase RimI-like enzyme
MELVDVTDRLGEPELREVLSASVGFPTPEKLARVAEAYVSQPSWTAFALMDGAEVVGIIGLESVEIGRGRIRHLAVAPERRRRGVGRTLIDRMARRAGLREIFAETDGDGVEFYRRCGFAAEPLDRDGSTERFLCRTSFSMDPSTRVSRQEPDEAG